MYRGESVVISGLCGRCIHKLLGRSDAFARMHRFDYRKLSHLISPYHHWLIVAGTGSVDLIGLRKLENGGLSRRIEEFEAAKMKVPHIGVAVWQTLYDGDGADTSSGMALWYQDFDRNGVGRIIRLSSDG